MLVYFAVILTVLLGFCGLAVDVGRIELRTNQLQAAADAGALAGAGELMHGSNTSTASTAAYNDVVQVATVNNIPAPSFAPQLGSTFSFYVGDNSVVEVQLSQSVPTFFLGVLSHATASMTLTVKADAQIPPCLMFMGNPTAWSTYDLGIASSSMNPPVGCPAYFKDGLLIDGFAHMNGGQVRTSGTAAQSLLQGWTYPTTIYDVPVLPDPLAYITAPSAAACKNATPISQLNQSSGTTVSLTPGTYCGKTATYTGTGLCNLNAYPITPAIDIQGTQVPAFNKCPSQNYGYGGNCTTMPTVNFAPGLYVIVGGINFNCVMVTGTAVTLYFTKSLTVGYGTSKIISSNWGLSAPTDSTGGGIPGISVMNDRNWTPSSAGSTEDFQWTYSTYYADGVLYLTGTGLDAYNLGMSAPNYLNMVIANMYNYAGTITPANNYATLPAGNPLRQYPSLVQ